MLTIVLVLTMIQFLVFKTYAKLLKTMLIIMPKTLYILLRTYQLNCKLLHI